MLFKSKSEFNGTVGVDEDRGYRFVSSIYKSRFPTTQTGVKISNPRISKFPFYPASLTLSLIHQPLLRKYNITMIGVAGGFLVNYLKHYMKDRINLTAIEIDPVMIEVAQKFFDVEHEILLKNGYDHVMDYKGESQDVVILDAFNGMYIPDCFNEDEFYKTLKRDVLQTGASVLAVNIVLNKEVDSLIDRIKSHFKYVHEYYSKGNLTLICTDANLADKTVEFNANSLQSDFRFVYNLKEMRRRYAKRHKPKAGSLFTQNT